MVWKPRDDGPGTLHHVCNRGLARRTLFEGQGDVDVLLGLLEDQVDAERIRLLSYAVLTNHYHLFVESCNGELSGVLRDVQAQYATYFNRTRGRSGPLFDHRFRSRPVTSDAYACAVVRYIDDNPVAAGLSATAEEYAHGSARHYAQWRRPRWLAVRRLYEVLDLVRFPRCSPKDYARRVWSRDLTERERWMITRRLEPSRGSKQPLPDLLTCSTLSQRAEWTRRALLADGALCGQPVIDPAALLGIIEECRTRHGALPSARRGATADGWTWVRAWGLRYLAGATLAETARILSISTMTARRLLRSAEHAPRANPTADDLLHLRFQEVVERVSSLGQEHHE